jgi:hypothetical protein
VPEVLCDDAEICCWCFSGDHCGDSDDCISADLVASLYIASHLSLWASTLASQVWALVAVLIVLTSLKMAMDIRHPCTRGYPVRWMRIWIPVFTRGYGYGFDFISTGKMKTGMKKSYPYPLPETRN